MFLIFGTVYAQQDKLSIDLEEAIEIAISENPTVKIAEQEIVKKEYALSENRGEFLPHVDASASYTGNIKRPVIFLEPGHPMGDYIEIGSKHSYDAGFSASMPLYSAPLLKSIEISEKDIEMAVEAARGNRQELTADVMDAFFSALLAREAEKVMKTSYENAKTNLENVKSMYEQGVVSEYDKISAEVRVRNLEPSVVDAENNFRMAVLRLQILMGVSNEVEIELDGELDEYKDEYIHVIADTQEDIDVTASSELQQMDLEKQMLERQYEMLRRQRLPTVSGFGNLQTQAQSDDLDVMDYNWVTSVSAGFSINIPIFTGFTYRNREQQMKVSMKQAEMQKEYMRDNLGMAATNSLKNMEKAIEEVESRKENVELAERGYEIARTRYRSGTGNITELRDSETDLTEARLSLKQAMFEYLSEMTEYKKVTGIIK